MWPWNEVSVPDAHMSDSNAEMVFYIIIPLQQDFLSHRHLFLGQNVLILRCDIQLSKSILCHCSSRMS